MTHTQKLVTSLPLCPDDGTTWQTNWIMEITRFEEER